MSVTATTRLFFPWISWTHHFPGRIRRQGFDALWRPCQLQSQAFSAFRVKLVCPHPLGFLCRLHLYLRIIEASHEHIWTPDSTVRIQDSDKAPVAKGDVGREGSWPKVAKEFFPALQGGPNLADQDMPKKRQGWDVYIHLQVKYGKSKKDETSRV